MSDSELRDKIYKAIKSGEPLDCWEGYDAAIDAIMQLLAQAQEEAKTIYESDIAWAIGFGIGSGQRVRHLEKRYPHLISEGQKKRAAQLHPKESEKQVREEAG